MAHLTIKVNFNKVVEDDYEHFDLGKIEVLENTIPVTSRVDVAETLAQSDQFHERIVWELVDLVERD